MKVGKALNNIFLTATVLFVATAFAGCYALANASGAVSAQLQSKQAVGSPGALTFAEGELTAQFKKIYAKESYFDECDFGNKEKILEVTRALDRHQSEIRRISRMEAIPKGVHFKKFGPFAFELPSSNSLSEDKWSSFSRGWPPLLKEFDQIKGTAVDARWLELDGDVRGLIHDEESRLQHGVFMGLTRTSGPMLLSIREALYECLDDDKCNAPKFSPQQRHFLGSSGGFRLFLGEMESNEVPVDEKRDDMFLFSETLTIYASRFELMRAAGSRVEGNTLIVPLDTSIFGDGESEIIAAIEKTWNVHDIYKIKIEPTANAPVGYKVKVGVKGGGRSSVHHPSKVMQLYDRIRLTTIIHEFGHILGFRDYYFTRWSKETCAYNIEFNSGDMMSDSTTGAVRASHWDLLQKTYWPKTFTPATSQELK